MRESSWRNYDDSTDFCLVCGCALDPDGNCPFAPSCLDEDDDLEPHDPELTNGLDNELWQDRE